MSEKFSVRLEKLITHFGLERINCTENTDDISIVSVDVNRPGIQLSGFYDCFDPTRIQLFGMVEHAYLASQPPDVREKKLKELFSNKIPVVIVTRGLEIFDELAAVSKEFDVPVLRTSFTTTSFLSRLIPFLHTELAPRITRHGVLVEVYGEGVLLLGESGVGKSEAAIELVKRGHRLIADDAVEIKKVSAITLVGSSPEIIRHFIEIRGIGIIDVKRLFGMGAVKDSEKIDLVLHLETWVEGKHYDRLGLTNEVTDILGLPIPSIVLPVKPGRNLAVIIEISAMNNRLKRAGYNAAEELNKRIMANMDINWEG
ncbi:MAG: HPr(Ser) kinase/phosphatase [Firmicutes bacterium]|nr:HPr(Ser) kinase/phosphatase [Bacillota bacterium]